ncbi:GNAT family N-acetyltransferase [Anaerocolumna sp. AGMB13020]|uniref:GNAT family N-acetyltransferase n=1 Tax=Anaerocolumna sp. AGMB13020 TaxID=3081750 RepID=UPI0029559427|nr:GNAT family N-acetyltransferase [Anaerocolumna sp. AGMB13020]WOO38422.1 GNAT family N-acetyltransferase [Anaerocolumna sp. AGMB13020]
MKYDIIHLAKEQWKGTILPIKYTTDKYYDVSMNKTDKGYSIEIEKKSFPEPVTHTPEEYDYPDKLYEDHWEHAYAWGVLADNNLIAAIETEQEVWSNRLRITELWVADEYHRQGIGHALIDMAKEQARRERRRAIILETQSCNVNAIDFYQHEGFQLIGMDTCCYKNNDLQRKEVRLEFGWFPKMKNRLDREEVDIRKETEEEWHKVELVTQQAFWNKHHLGCDEHYLVHKLRQDKDYLPELSRIAVKDGEIIGCIMYSKAQVADGVKIHDIVTFGPLCVAPEWQGSGVGELLLKETMALAADKGYKGIVIFGEPDYYPRVGFKTCDHFNITTAEGENFNAFMGFELAEGSMKDIRGKFYESEVFVNLPKEEVEEYNKNFPQLQKQSFPGQWD